MSAEFLEEPLPDLQPENGALIEADDALELSKLAYYQACFDFAEKPRRRTHKALEQTAGKMADAFEYQLKALAEDSSSYEYMVASSNAVTIYGKNRVDALNTIMEGSPIGHTKSEVPSESDWDVSPEQEEGMKTIIHNSALQVFVDTLAADTNALIDYVAESKAGRLDHFRHELLDHGIDIGKIALGTAAGVIIAKYISRDK